jgi:CHASE3 domain sensor protein
LDVKDTQVLSLDKSTTDADGASQQIQKADDSTVIEGITDVASSLTEEEQEELQRRAQDEEDSLRMIQLKDTEAALRAQSAQYMGVFDSFQTRLSQSNAVFAQKQAAIEQLTKEIRQLEKENKQFSAKLGQLAVSNRGYVIGNERLLKEREKVTRASDKYAELIATFQQDIGDMERMV